MLRSEWTKVWLVSPEFQYNPRNLVTSSFLEYDLSQPSMVSKVLYPVCSDVYAEIESVDVSFYFRSYEDIQLHQHLCGFE